MESQNHPGDPFSPIPPYPIGRRELVAGAFLLLFGLLGTNSILYGGFNLGFVFFGIAIVVTIGLYLLASGKRLTGYSDALLGLSLIILAAFARSDDGFVKFVMVGFLFVGVSLGFALTAGQNLRRPGSFASLADAFRGFFALGFGGIGPGFRGLGHTLKNGSTAGKNGLSVLLGLAIAVPVLLILIPLLMSADAAFEGLMALLPDFRLEEIFATVILGGLAACFLFGWASGLVHSPVKEQTARSARKGLSSLTVNTVLIAVVLVYLAYLASQLAYFTGGFSGILPEGYSTADYARRGFFEMAWLCAVNLSVMVLTMGLVEKKDKAPLLTRLLCLFIGIVTLFLVVTASAKMAYYISAYGLTRLRVLTEVIMVFLGLTTGVVSLWLFLPGMPYMKVILLMGLAIGAAVIWADVDTVVARCNVTAYQEGRLESIDVYYLDSLGDGAVPYIALLTQDPDPDTAQYARNILQGRYQAGSDPRSWNYAAHAAKAYHSVTDPQAMYTEP